MSDRVARAVICAAITVVVAVAIAIRALDLLPT